MIAKYPQHPAPEPADAAPHPVPAPADIECPADIDDLFANNRAGAKTWDEVLDGLEALSQYHKARGCILSELRIVSDGRWWRRWRRTQRDTTEQSPMIDIWRWWRTTSATRHDHIK